MIATSPSPSLRIGIVGGVERTAVLLERAARALGVELEYHGGHTAGRGAASLEALVRRVDVVVICTDVNSHNAVTAARRAATAAGKRAVIVRRVGPSTLAAVLAGQAG